MHVYEIRPRKDKCGADLISDALPFGRLWYSEPNAISNAIGYPKFFSRSHDAVIRVYDVAGNLIETHEHAGEFKVCEARETKSRHAGSVTADCEMLPVLFGRVQIQGCVAYLILCVYSVASRLPATIWP